MKEQSPSDDTLTTLMCLVEAIINNRQLTTVSDDPADLSPLTPNTLTTTWTLQQEGLLIRRRWRQVQYLADVFWRCWVREYLPLIQLRPKWREAKTNLKVGDIVLVVDYSLPRNEWMLGRVEAVTVGT